MFRVLASRLACTPSSVVSLLIAKALCPALVSVVSRLRWSRFFVFLVARLVLGLLAGAVVSFRSIVVRVRHTGTTLLN